MFAVAGSDPEPTSSTRFPAADRDRRRSERLLLTIPIRVEGVDPKGQKFGENTRTLVISRQGARIQLKRPVKPGTTVQITTLVGNHQGTFRVVGPTKPMTSEGGEWGVDCVDEKSSIWGIGFPPPQRDEAQCAALLECRQCHTVNLTPLSLVEHDVLEASGLLTKNCNKCGRATSWGFTEQVVGMPAPGQDAEPSISELLEPPRPESNRRVHARVALKLPIREIGRAHV